MKGAAGCQVRGVGLHSALAFSTSCAELCSVGRRIVMLCCPDDPPMQMGGDAPNVLNRHIRDEVPVAAHVVLYSTRLGCGLHQRITVGVVERADIEVR